MVVHDSRTGIAMPTDAKVEMEDFYTLVEGIEPMLAGRDPRLVGAVLADLLSTWLAAHLVLDNDQIARTQTDAMREELIAEHIQLVRKLVPENEKAVLKRKETKH